MPARSTLNGSLNVNWRGKRCSEITAPRLLLAGCLIRNGAVLPFALIRAEDHIISDRGRIFLRNLLCERNHSQGLKNSSPNHVEPLIMGQRARIAQIG